MQSTIHHVRNDVAAIAAFAAEVERQRREAEAARARAAQQWGRGKASNPLTYKQIAQAYQAAMNNFRAALKSATTSGMSAAQAQALKQQVAQTGKIEGALGAVTAFVEKRAGQKVEAAPAPQQVSPPPAPEGISPEAQQAFLHGGAAAQGWIFANAPQLQQSYLEQEAAAQERARKEQAQAADAARWAGLAAIEQAKIDAEEAQPWWEKALDATKTFVEEKIIEPVKITYQAAVVAVQSVVSAAQNKFEEVKQDLTTKWESAKQWADTNVVQPVKGAWERVKLYYSPAASLPRDPALRTIESFHQNQLVVTSGTGAVECVTTSAVMVRNIMNEQLAHLTGHSPLPDLTVDDYIKDLDSMGPEEWRYRIPSSQPPVLGQKIAGWMHPRLQLVPALEEFAVDLEKQYGYSFAVEQSSGNSYLDIARNVREGNLVIIHGMWDVSASNPQQWIGGNPHTLGPVISMDANSITLLDTGTQDTYTFTKEEFMKFWDEPTKLQVPEPEWLPESFRLKLTPVDLYTPPGTMTVVTPDTIGSPASTPGP